MGGDRLSIFGPNLVQSLFNSYKFNIKHKCCIRWNTVAKCQGKLTGNEWKMLKIHATNARL